MNPAVAPAAGVTRRGRRFASPLSRAFAAREGLDLLDVAGSGPQGRIVWADVLAALATSPAGGSAARADAGHNLTPFDAIPNSVGRKLIARRLTESMQQAPHFYVRIDCHIDRLQKLRADHAQRGKASINDFVIKAAALALKDVPAVNASYTEAAIRRYRQVNIAVAVALEEGLLTPVVENADTKTIAEIAQEVAALALQARSGTLPLGASRGATFSISNLGAYGVREFTAVINPPQGAILAVGAAEQRAVVVDGKLAIATVMTVTLSSDHRVIDGVVAARWLAAFKQHLENPRTSDVWGGGPAAAPEFSRIDAPETAA